MKYVSIDIETTGLSVSDAQILEMGFVKDDLQHPFLLSELPKLRVLIVRPTYRCEPFAASMHSELWRELAKHKGVAFDTYNDSEKMTTVVTDTNSENILMMCDVVKVFLGDRVTPAGKNFAGFDKKFMEVSGFTFVSSFRHRTLDPAPLYATKDDEVPPSLEECLKRAGLESTKAHTSIGDALDVIRVLRFKYLGKVE